MKQKIHYLFILFSFLFTTSLLLAQEQIATQNFSVISLKGFLGKEEIAKANKTLEDFAKTQEQTLVIEINSSSGDLNQVLDLAKNIYELKFEKRLKIVVYINDSALGPGAIIPFLADQLFISPFMSWGDIPYGAENTLSTNILRNRVTSLIALNNPRADLLRVMAAGMTDRSLVIIDDQGWRLATSVSDKQFPIISQGETLVVNQNQVKDLSLISAVLSPEKFRQQFRFSAEQSYLLEQIPAGLEISEEAFVNSLKKHIKIDQVGQNVIGHILIDDRQTGINQGTWIYVKNALDYYKKIKPIFVILELNTPGGEVFAAQNISDALKELDTQYNIPVVAFINNWAISAGAMLAYSCRYIVVVKDASMGAAEPVIAAQTGELKEASEKVNSALRADFANRARFYDRNPYIAEAMVDKDIILVLRHGKVIKLDSENQIKTIGPNPDVIISPKGKLLTLNAEQLIKYGVADLLLSPLYTEPITGEELAQGKWKANKMLMFQYPFFKSIPQPVVDSYRMDWKTRFFVILANPVVSSLLFLGMMIGFYLELSTPGFSLPGSVAIICLFLIVLSSFALEIGNILELILLITGFVVILVELFVLPTFGLLGFVGVIFFLTGLFGLMLPGIGSISFEFDTQTFNAAGEAAIERLAWLSVTIVVGLIIISALARYVVPSFSAWSRLILKGSEQEGYIAVEAPAQLPPVGSKGEAMTPLRPAGKIMIQEAIFDAVSAGSFIEKGEKIFIERLDGSTIIVNTLLEKNESI